jgi:dTDP-4-dehydrorhamnose reductase
MISHLSNKKVMVTGADGMLGRAFRAELTKHYPLAKVFAFPHEALDVTDRQAVLKHTYESYDFIIHCAADVNADRCETFPDRCHQIQVQGTQNVLELAAATNSKVFYPQSFLIFSGGDTLIDENTLPDPKSVYGRCKLDAEKLILSVQPNALVVRMAGFFGGDEKDKNFVGKFTRHLVSLLNETKSTYPVGDRVWQPTYTEDLAKNSLLLLDRDMRGVWSMGSVGEASFYDLAKECVRLLGFDHRIEIIPAEKNKIQAEDVARRPERAVLSNQRLIESGFFLQRPWRNSLADYLARPWFQSLFKNV